MKCIVPGCRTTTKKKERHVSIHCFPRDSDTCRKWLSAIKRFRKDVAINPRLNRVCSKHFAKNSFNFTHGRKTLKPNIVPTIFRIDELIKPATSATTIESASPSPIASPAAVVTPSPNSPIKNRRKSTHQRVMIDDEISFEDHTIHDDVVTKAATPIELIQPTSKLSLEYEDSSTESMNKVESEVVEIDDEELNPNDSLMKKVAFLRVCVNYLMLNLEMEPFDFIEKRRTLQDLMVEYNSNLNKIKEKNRTTLTGSSSSSSQNFP